MIDRSSITEHMDVKGSDGGHVGTVDHVQGDRIKLTRTDPDADNHHHFLHLDSVDRVEDGAVILNRTRDEARDEWGVEEVGVSYMPAPSEPGSSTAGP